VLNFNSINADGSDVGSNDDPDSRATSSRKSVQYIEEFAGGVTETEMTFPDGGGSNSELNITMPNRAKVMDASLDVEGLSTLGEYIYDYTNSSHKAYEGNTNKNPPTFKPQDYDNT
jgi:hypothetical protein